MKRNAYQTVTDAILAKLDTNKPWQRPWAAGAGLSMPINGTTGRAYHGSNVVMLWVAAEKAGYEDNRWATFKQWSEKGGHVRKGEKGTPVLWFKMLDAKDDNGESTGEGEDKRKIPCARVSFVFNAAQVEGVELEPAKPRPNPVVAVATAEQLVASSGAAVIHGGNRAFYRPSTDTVHMPRPEAFTGTETSSATEAYYGTLLHELTHWTGPRLDRTFGRRFGDHAYAAEELVAELGAAFLCAELGIASDPREDHARYLAGWIKMLQDDPRAFTTAASKAAKAADFLLAGAGQQQAEAA